MADACLWVCNSTSGNWYYHRTQLDPQQAANKCGKHGAQLAMVDDAQKFGDIGKCFPTFMGQPCQQNYYMIGMSTTNQRDFYWIDGRKVSNHFPADTIVLTSSVSGQLTYGAISKNGKIMFDSFKAKQAYVCFKPHVEQPSNKDNTVNSHTQTDSGNNSTTAIVGAIAAVLGLVLIAMIAYVVYKKLKDKPRHKAQTVISAGIANQVAPMAGESTYATIEENSNVQIASDTAYSAITATSSNLSPTEVYYSSVPAPPDVYAQVDKSKKANERKDTEAYSVVDKSNKVPEVYSVVNKTPKGT